MQNFPRSSHSGWNHEMESAATIWHSALHIHDNQNDYRLSIYTNKRAAICLEVLFNVMCVLG